MSKRLIFKYNEDDLLELLIEQLAKENGYGEFSASAIFMGTPNKDLRAITIIGEEDDVGIKDEDLEKIDKKIDYNGSHKNVTYITNTSRLEKKIRQKDF